MGIPEIGTRMKNTAVLLGDGSGQKLSELCGKKGLILYFYPRDSTPGCTREACDFSENHAALKRKGFASVGVSPDTVASHERFAEKYHLPFPLISDADRELCRKFGVWGEKRLYGKISMGVIRSTFVLDPALTVLLVYSPVKVDGHVPRILEDLAAL